MSHVSDTINWLPFLCGCGHMSFFGFTPDSVTARVKLAGDETRIPTLKRSLLVGSLGFGLASTAIFAFVRCGDPWVYESFGRLGPFLLATVLFIVFAGGSLSRLVIGPGRLARFYLLFSVVFIVYATCWTAAYFTLGGLTGELVGSVVGTFFMALILSVAFGAMDVVGRLALVLVTANLTGYFLGRGAFYQGIGGTIGMILYGACYGFGFGAGLGYVLFLAQEPLRRRLSARPGEITN